MTKRAVRAGRNSRRFIPWSLGGLTLGGRRGGESLTRYVSPLLPRGRHGLGTLPPSNHALSNLSPAAPERMTVNICYRAPDSPPYCSDPDCRYCKELREALDKLRRTAWGADLRFWQGPLTLSYCVRARRLQSQSDTCSAQLHKPAVSPGMPIRRSASTSHAGPIVLLVRVVAGCSAGESITRHC
jgi:hypothetical protein